MNSLNVQAVRWFGCSQFGDVQTEGDPPVHRVSQRHVQMEVLGCQDRCRHVPLRRRAGDDQYHHKQLWLARHELPERIGSSMVWLLAVRRRCRPKEILQYTESPNDTYKWKYSGVKIAADASLFGRELGMISTITSNYGWLDMNSLNVQAVRWFGCSQFGDMQTEGDPPVHRVSQRHVQMEVLGCQDRCRHVPLRRRAGDDQYHHKQLWLARHELPERIGSSMVWLLAVRRRADRRRSSSTPSLPTTRTNGSTRVSRSLPTRPSLAESWG